MSISKLVDFIGNINIAEDLKEDQLMQIGNDVVERFEEDVHSMDEWMEAVEKGQELVKQELHPKSTPWEGASNFKSSMMTEASLAFGNRASLELLRARNLIKADVIGLKSQAKGISRDQGDVDEAKAQIEQQSQQIQEAQEQGQEPDPQMSQQLQQAQQQIQEQEQAIQQRRDSMDDKQARADRITEVMNYQINHQMKEWRPDQKKLLYILPNVGAMFKKSLFDPLLGRNVSHVIHYPDFAVNQATTHIDTARSFTHILDRSANQLFENQQSGIWLDADIYPKDVEGDKGSNEDEEVTDATDNPNRFLEQYCFVDLDDDGYEEPYIVTVHEQTKKVVRIVARFDENSIMVTNQQGLVISLIEHLKAERLQDLKDAQQAGLPEPEFPEEPDFKGLKLARIEASQPITKYGFIPSMDGTFLDLGYFHLMGATTAGVNATTNQLIDAGTLSNRQIGLLAKGFRKKMGPISFRPGEFKSTELAPKELAQGILPMPIKEPSQTLFALNEKLSNEGRAFAASVDASGQITAQTAPTTALAVIQEQLIPLSALMENIIQAESTEFQILLKLNQKFIDPQLYKVLLDDPEADAQADFNAEGFDIIPTANSEMSSKMQRIQLAEVQMSVFDRVLQAQGNPIPIIRSFFEAIGSEITDEIFPDEQRLSPEDQQRLDALRQQQEQANQFAEQQQELTRIQIDLMKRAEDRKDGEAEVKAEEALAGVEKTLAETREVAANILLTLEKAETEEVTNQISIYTAQLEALNPQGTIPI